MVHLWFRGYLTFCLSINDGNETMTSSGSLCSIGTGTQYTAFIYVARYFVLEYRCTHLLLCLYLNTWKYPSYEHTIYQSVVISHMYNYFIISWPNLLFFWSVTWYPCSSILYTHQAVNLRIILSITSSA